MSTGQLRLEWVRGQARHPLNKTADRLALAARRGIQLGQSDTVRHTITCRIVSGPPQPVAA